MDAAHVGGIGGTFGGNPISCAAALAVLKIMDEEKLPQRAIEIGSKVVSAINQLKKEVQCIKSIRGLGAMQGIEIVDENGDPIFYRSKVASPDSEFLGQVFRVNDSYRRSLKLADLDNTYRDRLGRMKDDEGFIPPTPRTIDRMVLGGYDPATWTGTQDSFSFLPQMHSNLLALQ